MRLSREDFEMLHILQTETKLKSAIIAGGAIRDNYFKKPISDIDIFVDKKDFDDINTTPSSLFQRVFFAVQKSEINSNYCNNAFEVWNIRAYNRPYQIIVTNISPIEFVDQEFNIGMCKGYCDGKKIHYSRDFLYDAFNKKITIVKKHMTQYDMYRTLSYHIPKIRPKYNDFAITYTPENYQLALKVAALYEFQLPR